MAAGLSLSAIESGTKSPALGPPPDPLKARYPVVNEDETPLPRQWSTKDKHAFLGLSQSNLRVHYKGQGKNHKDAASVRASHPIPAACGVYYFEVKVISKGREGYMGIGLSTATVNMNRLPGWEKNSYGYHGDDGNSFCSSGNGQSYGPTFTTGDVIGCCVNLIDSSCFYTKNGVNLGIAFRNLPPNLYPTVGLQTPGEVVEANFGQNPFLFDIDDYMQEWRLKTKQAIENFSIANRNGEWQTCIHKIVTSYLIHNGYCSTAEAFARCTGQPIDEELASIRNRQRIQKLILSGRIREAIDTTRELYPGLLDSNSNLLFTLKCRQFIEMVNGTDLDPTNPLAAPPMLNTSPQILAGDPQFPSEMSLQNPAGTSQLRLDAAGRERGSRSKSRSPPSGCVRDVLNGHSHGGSSETGRHRDTDTGRQIERQAERMEEDESVVSRLSTGAPMAEIDGVLTGTSNGAGTGFTVGTGNGVEVGNSTGTNNIAVTRNGAEMGNGAGTGDNMSLNGNSTHSNGTTHNSNNSSNSIALTDSIAPNELPAPIDLSTPIDPAALNDPSTAPIDLSTPIDPSMPRDSEVDDMDTLDTIADGDKHVANGNSTATNGTTTNGTTTTIVSTAMPGHIINGSQQRCSSRGVCVSEAMEMDGERPTPATTRPSASHPSLSCDVLASSSSCAAANGNGSEPRPGVESNEVLRLGGAESRAVGGRLDLMSEANLQRILEFGRELHVMAGSIEREECGGGISENNKQILKDAISLLAYSDPWSSTVGHQLHPVQREPICTALNSAILELQGLPKQPPLELAISHAHQCLKVMSTAGIGSSAFASVADYL